DAYRIDRDFYLPAKSGARIYGAQLYWYAVRGTVRLSFRGRQIILTKDVSEALVDGRKIKLDKAMIVRAGKAFIPIGFFTTKAFVRLAGVDSKFDPKTRLLLVDHRSSVGPVRWFTYPGHTRIVLELDRKLRFQTRKRGRSGLDVTIPNGTIDWSERVDVGDGVLEFFHLTQEKKQARLTLKMQSGADGYKLLELKKPRRIVIDVARSKDRILAAKTRRVGYESPPSPKQTWREARRKKKLAKKAAKKAAKKKRARIKAAIATKEVTHPPAVRAPQRAGRIRIMVDPGHGGKDGGAVGRRGTLEKDINLAASRELVALLRQEDVFDVRLTRDSDTFIKLKQRSALANNFNADLFVSIHCNAADSRALSGFEVYFLSERASDPEAERLAEFENSVLAMEGEDVVLDEAAELLYALARTEYINDAAEMAGLMTRSLSKRVDLRNRGVKQAAFYVLRGANQPAVLVEMAFLSNGRDEAKLQSKKYRRKLVEGMYAGILDFARRKDWLEGKR
ncbi:MAG: hypothetical protein COB53_05700, partial [Elusimicrobia bacterium]